MKLKPSTSYEFSKSDLEFVLELAKVGHVHLLSNQVSLVSIKETGQSSSSLSFKEWTGSDESNKCDGMQLPSNWVIEYIGASDNKLHVTFGVKKVK